MNTAEFFCTYRSHNTGRGPIYNHELRHTPHKPEIFHFLILILLFSVLIFQNRAFSAPQVKISESPISRKIQQPTVTAIFEDPDGFLWIGTQHGLYKFDGTRLTAFNSSQNGNEWIPVSDIKGIIKDFNSQIVVATLGGGLLTWNESTKSFQPLQKQNLDETLYFTDLISSADGRIWAGSEDGLYLYNPDTTLQTSSFVKFQPSNEKGVFSAVTTDIEGNIYVAFGRNIYKIPKFSNSVTNIYSGDMNQEHHGKITALALDQGTQIYIGTTSGEIFSLDTTDNSLRSNVKMGGNSPISIITMLFHKGFLWIGTNNGLSYSDSSLSAVKTYFYENSGLSNNHVLTLVAEEDYIWIGTYRGLSTLSFVPFEIFNSQNSGIFNDVLAFEEDKNSNLWIGTFNGLYLLEKNVSSHSRYQYPTKISNLVDQRIMTLAYKGAELWVGFQKNGLQVLDTTTLKVSTPPIPMVEELEVTKILHTDKGKTWIATFNRGLFEMEHGKTTSHLTNRSLPETSVTILFELENGQLIASSEQKIYLLETLSNQFYPLKLRFDDTEKPPLILSISESRTGDIWIGTKDLGLFILPRDDLTSSNPHLIQTETGRSILPSTIYEIQFDDDGNAWCSTQTGIVKLDSQGNILARFSTADGLQGQDFNFGASYRDTLGQIYFGGSNGYNRFSPGDLHTIDTPPRLLITKVGISKKSQIVNFDAIGLEEIQLTHKDYFVQFEFSVLDFLDPEMNQYRYMLEGFDHDWIENGTRNSATYTSLPSGDYTLRVQGANSAGIWNREGLSLSIQVLPPPWFTWWAFALYTLIFMFLFWLGKRAYDSYKIERRAKEMAIEMVAAVEQADDEMQEQLEIHDDLVKSVYRHSVSTLNLVSEFIALKSSSLIDDDAREVAEGSVKRVSALALLEDCLYYQNEILLADLKKYTNVIVSQLLKDSPIGEESITTINEVSSQPIPIEQASAVAIILYELLENSIQHAFEEASGANYLHITLAAERSGQEDEYCRLSIQDNGVGIPSNIDPLLAQTSGFAIVAAMSQRLSGKLFFTAKNGTLVTIVFPPA